ncbi:MAG: hypothetical protein EA359_17485 [Balneolaceae bacterium]|nr:MAG: hypothetical protein EA359_17485 [Balneolaceae bacterium]
MRYDTDTYRLILKGSCFLFMIGVLKSEGLIAQERPNLVVEATRTTSQITVDGWLDEPEWDMAPVITGFRQVEPNQGEPARYDTEVRILYNDEFIFIGARLYDDPGEKPRVTDLRRNFDYDENDLFAIVFDTFNNRRDAISFKVTPYGNQNDLQVYDDYVFNRNYDVVWYTETRILDDGWTVEMAIPWKSLRYSEENETWGINFVRRHRRSNELSAWSPWPRAYTAYRMNYAGTISGLNPPKPPLNLRVQPYSIVQTDRTYSERSIDTSPKIGGEIKWSPSLSSVLDVTFNTDFAQADVDEQVINLTRFPVVFPEKRQFFLENANLFDLGTLRNVKPFFSRQIGLTPAGEPVPLDAGFRYIDQTTQRSIGALLIRQRESDTTPASWFGVGRYLHNFGHNKRVGFMFTGRHDEALDGLSSAQNMVGNVDSFIRFSSRVNMALNVSGSYDTIDETFGHTGDLWLAYRDNLMYAGLIQAVISSNYNPRAGFLVRDDIILTSPAVVLNWRPDWRPSYVRAFTPGTTVFLYHKYSDLSYEQGYVALRPFSVTFQSGARIQYGYIAEWQNIEQEFSPFGIRIEPGNYRFGQHEFTMATDQSASFAISILLKSGGYFDGNLNSVDVTSSVRIGPRVSVGSRYIRNMFRNLGIESEKRDVDLLITDIRMALNPRVQVSGFWQHNTSINTNSFNARFSWEFAPLSYIYLVFNDIHPFGDLTDTTLEGVQQGIFKITYLHQF